VQQASRRAVDAPGQPACAARVPHPALGGREAIGAHSQSAAATIYRDAAKHRMGHGHHLHQDVARVALPRCRHGSVLTHDRRVGGHAHYPSRARSQCRTDGGASTTTAGHPDSFGSRHPIRQRRLATILPLESSRAKHESEGQLLRQCRRRVLLQQPEERADQETDLQEPGAGDRRCGRLHRYLLQSSASSQSSWRAKPGAI